MSFLRSIFGPRPAPAPPPSDPEKKALEEYKLSMTAERAKAETERDRTARIAAYLRCQAERREDCRIDISWEELAQQGLGRNG